MLNKQATIPGIPTAEEEAKANFKLDMEKICARLVITPIRAISDDGEQHFVSIRQTIEVVPYPNPWSFGGMWGNGYHKAEEEEKVIADFQRQLDYYKKRGLMLPEVQIIRHPEETHHVPTEAQRQEAIKRSSEKMHVKASKPGTRATAKPSQPAQTKFF